MGSRRRGLGRGLDALLGGQPEPLAMPTPDSPISSLAVDQLEPNRYQPRSIFDDTGLEELAESIRTQGVVQPIVVTPRGEDRYVIIAGERRWRAARRAGLRRVPVVLRQVADDRQILELALVENLQRADLNAIEEAEAYRTLGETFELSQEEIAARVGKGRTTITNAIRLLRLPQPIQGLIRDGQLTAGQARPLLAIADADQQIEVAERAVRKGLTARALEALVAAPGKARQRRAKKKELDVNTRAAVEHLTQVLQTRVEIVRHKRGGSLKIRFHSEEELIRLYDLLIQRTE